EGGLAGGPVRDRVEQAPLLAGIDGREDAEGAVVQLVGRQVTGEVGQGPAQVGRLSLGVGFFPPPPPPSSASWRRGRRRGGRATGGRKPPGRAGRPPPPTVRPGG